MRRRHDLSRSTEQLLDVLDQGTAPNVVIAAEQHQRGREQRKLHVAFRADLEHQLENGVDLVGLDLGHGSAAPERCLGRLGLVGATGAGHQRAGETARSCGLRGLLLGAARSLDGG